MDELGDPRDIDWAEVRRLRAELNKTRAARTATDDALQEANSARDAAEEARHAAYKRYDTTMDDLIKALKLPLHR